MSKAPASRSSALKGHRKGNPNRESASSYLRADSRSIWKKPIAPKYRKAAAAIAEDPKKFTGKFVPLVDLNDDGQPESFLELDSLAAYTLGEIEGGFKDLRQETGDDLFVVFYERVSTEGQALEGKSLPAMFRKGMEAIHRVGAKVAGVAIDVDGGDKDERPALKEAMDWIHNRRAHCIMVPVPNRMDRDEVNFGVRMKELDSGESWLYYGRSYGDLRMSALVWRDVPTRERPVAMVRGGEQYLKEGRAGVAATTLWKLEEGYLANAKKEPRFCFYDVVDFGNPRPRSERRIVHSMNAKREYEEVRDRIRAAALADDKGALDEIAADFAMRRGKAITTDTIAWELRVGWLIGVNQSTPFPKDDLHAVCDWLALEDDQDRFDVLMDDLDYLEELGKRKRNPKTRPDDDVDETSKAKIAELQAIEGKRIAYRLTCDCTSPPTPVHSLGPAEANKQGFPQDWVVCPACGLKKSGSPSKTREPGLPLVRMALALPDDCCIKCGGRSGLVDSMKVQFGLVEVEVWKCRSCVLPFAAAAKRPKVLDDFPGQTSTTAPSNSSCSRSLMDF